MSIRVLVADDHPSVRAGVRVSLAAFQIDVAGEAASPDELFTLLTQVPVEVVLLDIRFHPNDGFEVLKSLRKQFGSIPVVMFSGYEHPNFIAHSYQLGAAGYLPKTASAERFAQIVRAAAKDKMAFTGDEIRKVSNAYSSHRLSEKYDAALTRREVEVLGFLALGDTNKMIAERMNISRETVKEHVQHVLQKIGVNDRTQAVYWGLSNGVVQV